MSEYLRRCQELSEVNRLHDDVCATNKGDGYMCDCPTAVFNRPVHTSPAYIKLLNHALQLERDRIPEELFDEFVVLRSILSHTSIKRSITLTDVSDVLYTVVRMIRERIKLEG